MKVILIDDETLALDFLEHQINKVGSIQVVEKFNRLDLEGKFALIEEIDVVFLDIEMPEMNGIELAEILLEKNPSVSIVFVTAYNHYAVKAFELNALDYLLKPVQKDRLQKTLERIQEKLENKIDEPLNEDLILYLNVCGELTFTLSKDHRPNVRWRTTKARELFLYLLQHQGKTISKYDLIELLWPEFEPEKAYAQLYTVIYHIRKTLEPFNGHFSLKNKQEGYNLSTRNIVIDIVKWENSIRSAPPLNIETIVEYETMMALYTGAYLQKYDYLWAEAERFRLEQLWLATAYEMANCYYVHDDLENAEKWFMQISNVRPEDERAHFSLMKLYATLGYGILVNHQYEQLEKNLAELGLKMSTNIERWYESWNKHRKVFR